MKTLGSSIRDTTANFSATMIRSDSVSPSVAASRISSRFFIHQFSCHLEQGRGPGTFGRRLRQEPSPKRTEPRRLRRGPAWFGERKSGGFPATKSVTLKTVSVKNAKCLPLRQVPKNSLIEFHVRKVSKYGLDSACLRLTQSSNNLFTISL